MGEGRLFIEGINKQLDDIQKKCKHKWSDEKYGLMAVDFLKEIDGQLVPFGKQNVVNCLSRECIKCGTKDYVKVLLGNVPEGITVRPLFKKKKMIK